MTVDVARLQALYEKSIGSGAGFDRARRELDSAMLDAMPALLVVVAERDKLHRDGAAMVGDHVELQNTFETMRKERDKLAATVARVEAALGRHPVCDVHDDNDPVTCGWKHAVQDITAALTGSSA